MGRKREATVKEFGEAQWSLAVLDESGETRKQRDAAIPLLYPDSGARRGKTPAPVRQ